MVDRSTRRTLIDKAQRALNPVCVDERLFGDVASALVTRGGSFFTGVCIDTPSWGLCAERSAIATMVTAREYRIAAIVAVWRDGAEGELHVVAPCGGCRAFIGQVDPSNMDAEVVLGAEESTPLRELLPLHGWKPNAVSPAQ